MKKLIISAFAVLGLSAATISLNPGWNLVGSTNSIDLSKDFNNSDIKVVWRWYNGEWQAFSPDENIRNLIQNKGFTLFTKTNPNDGFWVLTDNNININLENKNNLTLLLPLVDEPTNFDLSDIANKTFKILHNNWQISFNENGEGEIVNLNNNDTIGNAVFVDGLVKINLDDTKHSTYELQKIVSNENGAIVLVSYLENGKIQKQFLDNLLINLNPIDMSTLNYPVHFYMQYQGFKFALEENRTVIGWGDSDDNVTYTIEDGKVVIKNIGMENENNGNYDIDKLQIIDNIGRYSVILDNSIMTSWHKDNGLVDKTFDDLKNSNISVLGYYIHSDNTLSIDPNYEDDDEIDHIKFYCGNDLNITYNEVNSTYLEISKCDCLGCQKQILTINPSEGKVSKITYDNNSTFIVSTSPIYK